MSQLHVVPYHFDRNEEVVALLHKVFKPWGGDDEYFAWKYRKIDESAFPPGWIIEKDGKIIAFNGYRHRLLRIRGQIFQVAQSFDTATDPDCRGQGLFGILQKNAYKEMQKYDIAWVYGWTSEIGYKVFTKKVGWKVWAHQRYLMKVLNAKKFAAQKIRSPFLQFGPHMMLSAWGKFAQPWHSEKIEVREEEIFPESADSMCKAVCQKFGMITLRDVPYLRWKLSKPHVSYKLLCAYDGGAPCGYAVLAERENNMEIDDCLATSSLALSALLSRIEYMARKNNNDLIWFRVNEKHPWAGVFYRAGYFWSNTTFRMLGRKLVDEHTLSFDTKHLHWTFFDKNE